MSLWHYVFPSFSGRRDAAPYWYAPPRRRGMGWMIALAFVAGAGGAFAVTQSKWDASTATATPVPQARDTVASDVVAAPPLTTGSVAAPSAMDARAARFEELKDVAALAASSNRPAAKQEEQPALAVASTKENQTPVANANSDERGSAKSKRPPHRAITHPQRTAQSARRDPASGDRLVYLYDEIQPNGERVRIYRRAHGRDEASVAQDRYGRRGFFDFDPPWGRW